MQRWRPLGELVQEDAFLARRRRRARARRREAAAARAASAAEAGDGEDLVAGGGGGVVGEEVGGEGAGAHPRRAARGQRGRAPPRGRVDDDDGRAVGVGVGVAAEEEEAVAVVVDLVAAGWWYGYIAAGGDGGQEVEAAGDGGGAAGEEPRDVAGGGGGGLVADVDPGERAREEAPAQLAASPRRGAPPSTPAAIASALVDRSRSVESILMGRRIYCRRVRRDRGVAILIDSSVPSV